MLHFALLWLIHGLTWFTLSALLAVLRGNGHALHIKNSFAIGLLSALLNFLVLYYWRNFL